MKHLASKFVSHFKSGSAAQLFVLLVGITLLSAGAPRAALASFSNESATSDGTNFTYKVNYTGTYAHFDVFIDVNKTPATGYTINGIGADYLIEDGRLYKSTTNGSTWGWSSLSATVQSTSSAGTVQYSVALTAIGSPTTANVAFQASDSSWNPTLDPTVASYPQSTGVSYYVDATNGNDNNSGKTTALAWKTAQKAGNTATPGSTVYFLAGTYAPFDINVSGSSSGNTTFQPAAGATAIIDGTGWNASYDHGLIHIANRSYITVSGFEIRYGSSTSSTSSPVGVMVDQTANHINILNNKIHDITNTASSGGNAHGILIRGNSSSGDIDTVKIDGNQIYALKTGSSEAFTLVGNVTGFTVSNNTIHDINNIGLDIQGGSGTSPLVDQARNGQVVGNIVYNCSTTQNPYYGYYSCAGLYVDGGDTITMERNVVYKCDYGIQTASEKSGKVSSNVIVRSNLIYQNYSAGLRLGGYSSDGSSNGGTSNCTFVNNTLYLNNTKTYSDGEVSIGYRATGNKFYNNIFYTGSQDVFVKDFAGDNPVGTFDYNRYFSTYSSSDANASWQISPTSTVYTLANWKSASGQDAHSLYSDPAFVNASQFNLDTNSGSSARNAGNNLGSSVVGTLDFAGNARVQGTTIDIGAYEH